MGWKVVFGVIQIPLERVVLVAPIFEGANAIEAPVIEGVVANVLNPKGALGTTGSLFTGVDVTDLVTREAWNNNGSFFLTDDIAKVTFLWECPR